MLPIINNNNRFHLVLLWLVVPVQVHAFNIQKTLLSVSVQIPVQGPVLSYEYNYSGKFIRRQQISSSSSSPSSLSLSSQSVDDILQDQIRSTAISLWGGMHNIPTSSTTSINIDAKVHTDMYENDDENNDKNNQLQIIEGEAKYKKYDDSSTNNNNTTKHKHKKQSSSYSDRFEYFQKKAVEEGCPKAQHSYALLLWNGFCSSTSNSNSSDDAVESAKFHAAAAYQNHLDSIAVFGGCLRTGSGVKKNVPLGLKLIEYSASMGNPTGINKKAALLEQLNDDEVGAFHLYQTCYDNGIGIDSRSGTSRVNALLLFNLGWYYVNGLGIERKDVGKGIELWKDAADMAPDEGSEESAWYLYEHYKRDDPREAQKWFDLAFELGYPDAIEER